MKLCKCKPEKFAVAMPAAEAVSCFGQAIARAGAPSVPLFSRAAKELRDELAVVRATMLGTLCD